MKYSKKVIEEIQNSIDECEKQTSIEGSEALYDRLIAKFSVIDPNFKIGLPNSIMISSNSSEFDYRPQIKAIKEKLRIMLPHTRKNNFSEDTRRIQNELNELILAGESVLREEYYNGEDPDFDPDRVVGPIYDTWALDVEIFSERYLKSHPLFKKIKSYSEERYQGVPRCVRTVINCLVSISKDHTFFTELDAQRRNSFRDSSNARVNEENKSKSSNRVFLVHGHDNEVKQSVARALEKANLEVVILHEKANEGMTIIEKLEKYTDVTFAIVLYSPCDVGRARLAKPEEEKPRARQNVVFEHGYLNARLGRDRVCALLKENVEKPSDIDGVLYISMDDRGAWKSEVAREMKKAGLVFNLEALIY